MLWVRGGTGAVVVITGLGVRYMTVMILAIESTVPIREVALANPQRRARVGEHTSSSGSKPEHGAHLDNCDLASRWSLLTEGHCSLGTQS